MALKERAAREAKVRGVSLGELSRDALTALLQGPSEDSLLEDGAASRGWASLSKRTWRLVTTSFVIDGTIALLSRRIERVFTFDSHFRAAGFTIWPT